MSGSGATLPATIGPIVHLRSTPAEAGEVGIDFRTVAASLQDVEVWADRGAAPADWSGRTGARVRRPSSSPSARSSAR